MLTIDRNIQTYNKYSLCNYKYTYKYIVNYLYCLGKQVKRHCDENTSTTCASCPAMTYTNSPNGLTECLPCLVCNGLRVKQACTLISNTVCEPLSGYYCIDLLSSCKKAVKYSTCSPGQYINQTGQSFIIQTALIYMHKA
uniref:TNFR-Cys domain-containing protein n=1 Tax=Sinocyclocheilus anshuiensis TaxID=1608454 RepID=A0A671K3J6_9TELE